MRKLVLAAAAAAALASPAAAADLPVSVPAAIPVPMVFNWSGLYVGAHLGYQWSQGDFDFAYPSAINPAFSNGGFNTDSALGGVFAGFNMQNGAFVFGLEGDVSYARHSASGRFFTYANGDNWNGAWSLDWQGSLRGRLGYAFDRTLVYATGGVAFGRAEASLFASTAAGATFGTNRSETLVGWTIGAGVEYAWTNNLTVRVEYRYTDLGNIDVTLPAGPLPAPRDAAARTSFDVITHDVRVGVSYRF